MSYTKEQFNNCVFNPGCKGRIQNEYPRINEIIDVTWNAEPRLDNIIRYVICCYDPKSPMVMNERDMNYRKGIAAEFSGFDMTDEEFLNGIYNCSNLISRGLTLKYLMRFARSKEWAAICAIEFTYWESIKELLDPISSTETKAKLESVMKKSAIKNEVDADIKRLENYYAKFFGEDTELIEVTKSMRPEDYAKLK